MKIIRDSVALRTDMKIARNYVVLRPKIFFLFV